MSFTSFDFIIYLLLVVFCYFLFPHRFRTLLLLVFGCYFYITFIPKYIFVLFVLIIIDYASAIFIEKYKKYKKIILLASIASNIGMLFFFKYINFFTENISGIAQFFHLHYPIPILTIILPIGISFHTFQSLSYVIEVYKKKQKAEKNFFTYALYVLFFPQLAAGPIERPQHMLPQLHQIHNFSVDNVTNGARRIFFGMFKKMIIADNLAVIVNQVFGNSHDYIGLPLVIATVAFAFQIYCDFSGYSDIAIGSARMLGFRLMENFDHPYQAISIADFWRRWHISLSTWLRDYIYIPLGGSRVRTMLVYRNILVTFLISGLWHGASWNFVVWGGLHGAFLIVEHASTKILRLFHPWVKVSITFIFVLIAWIFFRASSLAEVIYIVGATSKGWGAFFGYIGSGNREGIQNYVFRQGSGLGVSGQEMLLIVFSLLVLLTIERYQNSKAEFTAPVVIRWGIYVIVSLLLLNFTIIDRVPFMYFQF